MRNALYNLQRHNSCSVQFTYYQNPASKQMLDASGNAPNFIKVLVEP